MRSSKERSIDVLGLTYKVVETEDRNKLPESAWGMVHHDKGLILIYKEMSEEAKRFTLWHELVHCIEYRMSLELEEDMIDRIAAGIDYITSHNKL